MPFAPLTVDTTLFPEGSSLSLITEEGVARPTIVGPADTGGPTVVQNAGPWFIPETTSGFVSVPAVVPELVGTSFMGVEALWPYPAPNDPDVTGLLAIVDAWISDASTGEVTVRFEGVNWPGSTGQLLTIVAWPQPTA